MFICMRTTINLNDRLFRDAKRRAAQDGTTLGRLLEDALRVHLNRPAKQKSYSFEWRTERGRLQPGVRLDDRDALFDLMDGRH